jgi:hypothetical protein
VDQKQGFQTFLGATSQKMYSYQKYTKWALNVSNGHQIDQIAIYQDRPLQDPPKFTKIWGVRYENIPSGNPDQKRILGKRGRAGAEAHEGSLNQSKQIN